MPFLITESRKIIWPFHALRKIQNKISRSRKNEKLIRIHADVKWIYTKNHGKIKFSITRHGKSIGDPLISPLLPLLPCFGARNCRSVPFRKHSMLFETIDAIFNNSLLPFSRKRRRLDLGNTSNTNPNSKPIPNLYPNPN